MNGIFNLATSFIDANEQFFAEIIFKLVRIVLKKILSADNRFHYLAIILALNKC